MLLACLIQIIIICQNSHTYITLLQRWLDPKKSLKKQIGSGNLFFRVKFYVMDPSKLQEEYTRYHFYLQVRRDIMSGRLIVPPSAACLLASYMVQCGYRYCYSKYFLS